VVADRAIVASLRIWRLGVRIPRGAPPSSQLSGPVTESLADVRAADCDQTATTLAGTPKGTATTMAHACSSATDQRRRGGTGHHDGHRRCGGCSACRQRRSRIRADRDRCRQAPPTGGVELARSPNKRDAVIVRFRNPTTQTLPLRGKLGWGRGGAAELNISRLAAATADGAHPGRSFANRDAALASQLRWLGQSAGAKPTKNLYRPSRLRRRSALGSPRGRARLRAAGDDKCVGG
jgi:hypothetical protein